MTFELRSRGLTAPFSRRRLLAATTAASALATIRGPWAALAQTPVATPPASPTPDLTGVVPRPLTGKLLADFEAYIATKVGELHVPGTAVAVVQNGQVVYLQGFGVRELGQPESVTGDTLMRIGSITKSFSSLLAATLVDAGRLRWTTPLVDLLPAFAVANPSLTPRLTVRDAFTAATGLPRRDLELFFYADRLTPERMIASIAQLPLTVPYGAKYQYNNQMVAAGGFAAAVADGGSPNDLSHAYAIALREEVLNPVGMPRSTLELTQVLSSGDYAAPHAGDLAGTLHPLPLLEDDAWIVPVAPAGALWSSAREMASYLQIELGHGVSPAGNRVVSVANLEQTWQPGIAIPAAPGTPPMLASTGGHYGLGWGVGTYGGQRLISHSGGTLGFNSELAFLPDADLGVVILTNGAATETAFFAYLVQFQLLETVFDQPATIDAFLTHSVAAVEKGRADLLAHLGDVTPSAVTPYLGRYTNPVLGELTLQLENRQLRFAAGEIHSALRPQLDEAGKVTAYILTDPPLGIFPPEFSVSLRQGRDGQPRVVLTAAHEVDSVYTFAPAAAAATPTPSSGDFTGLVNIGGRSLYFERRGAGSPTVILEAGYRSPATVWTEDLLDPGSGRTMVFPGVARFTRVCAYERPGTDVVLNGKLVSSRSTPVPMPRTAQSVVNDLHTLLHVAGVKGPYVLVGHSLGGLFVRLYASAYPAEVAGMVLVDAWTEELKTLLTPAEWADYVRFNSEVPSELKSDRTYETIDFAAASAAMRQAAAAHPLRPMPLVVLSHGQPFGVPAAALGFDPAKLEQAWATAQDGLAKLVPDARHVIATKSGHYIQLQQPELVIAAIRQVVDAVRDPSTWMIRAATPQASP